MRCFNTAGPIVPGKHYSIPPLDRLDLDFVLRLVRNECYFVLHAPRQTGKTSTLRALQDLLNSGAAGTYRCVRVNFEVGAAAGEDTSAAMQAMLDELALRAEVDCGDAYVERVWPDILQRSGPHGALKRILTGWAQVASSPLVLLIDEIDALVGETLLSVLRQLRSGYEHRPDNFPHSIVLCGVRDVRDYRLDWYSDKRAKSSGGSPFNISAASLRLGDFTRDEVASLLAQHTDETGQAFLPEAQALVWERTRGQPWLVNAICNQACFDSRRGRDRARSITAADILDAQEVLIESRAAHIDQLADKLQQDRVRRVIEPLLTGTGRERFIGRDIEYVSDLGLIARGAPLRIANPIYREVVPRELTAVTQAVLQQETAWYVDDDRCLNMSKLLGAFQQYFREHSESWLERYKYKEAGPHLLLHAFLQRVVNGGGRIEREYGLGRGRADLMIIWPRDGGVQRIVIECKILHRSLGRTLRVGARQTADYMDRCGADEGHLILFDRRMIRWRRKVFRKRAEIEGFSVQVWGMLGSGSLPGRLRTVLAGSDCPNVLPFSELLPCAAALAGAAADAFPAGDAMRSAVAARSDVALSGSARRWSRRRDSNP